MILTTTMLATKPCPRCDGSGKVRDRAALVEEGLTGWYREHGNSGKPAARPSVNETTTLDQGRRRTMTTEMERAS